VVCHTQIPLDGAAKLARINRPVEPIFTIALPAMLAQIATPFGNYVMTSLISAYGDSAVAAWAVASRLTIVAFGGIFALSGAINGIFAHNFGAGLSDRVRTTYRDALIFCAAYSLVTCAVLIYFNDLIAQSFGLDAVGTDVLRAFTYIGAGAFLFSGALFVSNAAFNNLGKPLRSTLTSWLQDGVCTLPAGLWLTGIYGASGVTYAQALVSALVGALAARWGWVFVLHICTTDPPQLDLTERRAYRDINRYRRR
jgi:Na+-driven multidrug efflux pump